MDARLRILERQAQSSGVAADWEKYARALQQVVDGHDAEDPIIIWVARVYLSDIGDTHITLYATEHEARGHVVTAIFGALGCIEYEPEMDELWWKKYIQFADAVKQGKYDEAWGIWYSPGYLADETGGLEYEHFEVESQCIARCSPKLPPTYHTMKI